MRKYINRGSDRERERGRWCGWAPESSAAVGILMSHFHMPWPHLNNKFHLQNPEKSPQPPLLKLCTDIHSFKFSPWLSSALYSAQRCTTSPFLPQTTNVSQQITAALLLLLLCNSFLFLFFLLESGLHDHVCLQRLQMRKAARFDRGWVWLNFKATDRSEKFQNSPEFIFYLWTCLTFCKVHKLKDEAKWGKKNLVTSQWGPPWG